MSKINYRKIYVPQLEKIVDENLNDKDVLKLILDELNNRKSPRSKKLKKKLTVRLSVLENQHKFIKIQKPKTNHSNELHLKKQQYNKEKVDSTMSNQRKGTTFKGFLRLGKVSPGAVSIVNAELKNHYSNYEGSYLKNRCTEKKELHASTGICNIIRAFIVYGNENGKRLLTKADCKAIDDFINPKSDKQVRAYCFGKKVKTLTKREEEVSRMTFGVGTAEDHTEVRQDIEEFRESIRQIEAMESIRQVEAKALRKLRHPSRSNLLKAFYGEPNKSNSVLFVEKKLKQEQKPDKTLQLVEVIKPANKLKAASIIAGMIEDKLSQWEIPENIIGLSYEGLFSKKMEGSRSIEIVDSYIHSIQQLTNLIEFLSMYRKIIPKTENCNVHLVTKSPNGNKTDKRKHEEYLKQIKYNFVDEGIKLTFEFARRHARSIKIDNGWKISWDRGLDIFHQSEYITGKGYSKQQTERQCKEFEITFSRWKKS